MWAGLARGGMLKLVALSDPVMPVGDGLLRLLIGFRDGLQLRQRDTQRPAFPTEYTNGAFRALAAQRNIDYRSVVFPTLEGTGQKCLWRMGFIPPPDSISFGKDLFFPKRTKF